MTLDGALPVGAGGAAGWPGPHARGEVPRAVEGAPMRAEALPCPRTGVRRGGVAHPTGNCSSWGRPLGAGGFRGLKGCVPKLASSCTLFGIALCLFLFRGEW